MTACPAIRSELPLFADTLLGLPVIPLQPILDGGGGVPKDAYVYVYFGDDKHGRGDHYRLGQVYKVSLSAETCAVRFPGDYIRSRVPFDAVQVALPGVGVA
ncbi:MAG: hypothetical protein IT442_16720 [Phycisphaeraceae bacterium]|nr:hypothetical protein [Phycisphaeraceae bacterium]